MLYSAGIVIFFGSAKKREYLLLHYASGHWDFPKGKIEKGETKEQAALRELEEETGLQADISPGFTQSFSYYYKDYEDGLLTKKIVYFFVGESNKRDVVLSREHIGSVWLPYEEALEKVTYKNAKELLQAAESFLLSRPSLSKKH